MTTEEIMRLQAPKTFGEWAFQGFPGRRRREERARSLANEGMQQEVSQASALAGIQQGRALEFLREQARIAEEQARYENALRIQAGQILGREGVQNTLDQARGMVPINENAAIGQEMLKYGAQDQMELVRRKQEENALRQEVGQSEAGYNRARATALLTPKPAEAPTSRFERVGEGGLEFTPQGDVFGYSYDPTSMQFNRTPVVAANAPMDARLGVGEQPGLGPVTAPPKAGGWFGNNPGKTLVPGATGKTSQVKLGPNVGKDEGFQTGSSVSPVSPIGLAGQQVASGIGDFLSRSAFRRPMQAAAPSGPSEAEQISLYQQSQQQYQPSRARMFLKSLMMRDPSVQTAWDTNQRNAAELRRAKAFQTLQSLYQ